MSDGFVPKYGKLGQGFSKQEILQSYEHPGRRTDGSQTAASWIADLTDLKKLIVLCSFCRAKFNHAKNHYRFHYVQMLSGASGHDVVGICDACKQNTANMGGGVAYVHEETYKQVNRDPGEARREARQKARRAWSVSEAINR